MTIYSNPPQKMGNFSVNSMHSTRLSWSSYSAACWGTWRRPCWAGAAPVRAGAFPRDLRQLLFLGWKNQLNISDLVVLRSIFFELVFCKDVLLENHRRGMMMDDDPQWLSQIFQWGGSTTSQRSYGLLGNSRRFPETAVTPNIGQVKKKSLPNGSDRFAISHGCKESGYRHRYAQEIFHSTSSSWSFSFGNLSMPQLEAWAAKAAWLSARTWKWHQLLMVKSSTSNG